MINFLTANLISPILKLQKYLTHRNNALFRSSKIYSHSLRKYADWLFRKFVDISWRLLTREATMLCDSCCCWLLPWLLLELIWVTSLWHLVKSWNKNFTWISVCFEFIVHSIYLLFITLEYNEFWTLKMSCLAVTPLIHLYTLFVL